jgi:hypothetical protein
MVFLGDTAETDPAIRFNDSDLRRLLLHRLEVLEAALLRLAEFRGEAAKAQGRVSMGLFNTSLLIHVLEGIVEEIERVDPNSPALAQLRYTIEQKICRTSTLALYGRRAHTRCQCHMSVRPGRSLLDALRAALRKAEADHPETPTLDVLKRALRERIAELESSAHREVR